MKNFIWSLVTTALLFGAGVAVNAPAHAQTAPSQLDGCQYNSGGITLATKQTATIQCDSTGQLKISGTISASSSEHSTAAAPTYVEGTDNPLSGDLSGGLRVNCTTGCAGGTFNNNADAVATSATNGQAAAWLYGFNGTTWDRLRSDANKYLNIDIQTITATLSLGASSAVIGHVITDAGSVTAATLSAETTKVIGTVRIASGGVASGSYASGSIASGACASGCIAVGGISDGADVTQGTKADAKNAATDTTAVTAMSVLKELSFMAQNPAALPANQSMNEAQINGVTPLMGNGVTGTGSQRVTIASDNTAFTVNAAQSGTWNINNVSGTVSLPTGAATAAKQPALGTAGTPSTDVLSVQGEASMTPILVTPVPQAATGGTTLFTLTLAASTNATNVKASAGQLYSISGFNLSSTTPVWISLYNNSGTPTCGTSITQQFLIPGSATGTGFVYDFATPKGFSSGIAFCATTGIAGTGSPAATNYVLNMDYK